MRILITGGAGFLGAALANRLVKDGHTVLALDDLTAGDPRRLSPAVLLTRGDVRDVPKLWTLLQGVDCVYHLAARVRVPESIHYPSDYNAVNVGGTVALMEAMRDTGVRRVVFASSGALYGEQTHQPVHENQLPNPNSPYGVSKVAAEYYLATLGTLYDIETVSLRVFNAYGPSQDLPPSYPPVVPQLLRQAQAGGSLVIFGDGAQTRDFVFIDDVVDAFLRVGASQKADGQVYNLGGMRPISLRDLAQKMVAIAGHGKVELIPWPEERKRIDIGDVYSSYARIENDLGWAPKTCLEDGLRRTFDYYRANRSHYW